LKKGVFVAKMMMILQSDFKSPPWEPDQILISFHRVLVKSSRIGNGMKLDFSSYYSTFVVLIAAMPPRSRLEITHKTAAIVLLIALYYYSFNTTEYYRISWQSTM